MGTKTNPGEFDCYASAKDDEPMFVLLARDERAPAIVYQWALRYGEKYGFDHPKTLEAFRCAGQMREWRKANPDV